MDVPHFNPHEYPGWLVWLDSGGRWHASRNNALTDSQREAGCKTELTEDTYQNLTSTIIAQSIKATWYQHPA